MANNTISAPLNFNISAPDLKPIAFQVQANTISGQNPPLTIVWGVTNQGAGAVGADYYWTDQLFISGSDTPDPESATLLNSSYEHGPLAAGSAYWRTNTIRLPVTQDGSYYLFFKANADANPLLYESDYSNNLAAAAFNFQLATVDLEPIVFSGPSEVTSAYSEVTFVWGVTNHEPGPSWTPPVAWTDSVVLTRGENQSVVKLWNWTQTGVLGGGEVYWSTNRLSLPFLPPGTYRLNLMVDSCEDLPESNRTNNFADLPLKVAMQPSDIAPILFNAPAAVTCPPGDVTISWGVTNQGAGAAFAFDNYWVDRLYIGPNQTVDSSATYLGDFFQMSMVPPGGNYWRTNAVDLRWFPSGKYYLLLELDAFNSLNEQVTTNNFVIALIVVTQLPLPDLSPVLLQAPTNVVSSPNPIVTLVWGVTNAGFGPAQSRFGWQDTLYVSRLPVPDGSEVMVTSWLETETLEAGNCYKRTNTVTLPVTTSGSYYYLLRTDSNFGLSETDKENNLVALPVAITIQPPDLAPVFFQAPGSFSGGPPAQVTVIAGITNQGPGPALAAEDTLYISAMPVRDLSAREVVSWFRTNTVPPGGVYWLTNDVTLPVSESGDYYLIFETDRGNALQEDNPANNLAMAPIRLDLFVVTQAPRIVDAGFLTGGVFALAVAGEVGTKCTLQCTTNLLNWVSVGDFTCTNASVWISDPHATNSVERFYRIVRPPQLP